MSSIGAEPSRARTLRKKAGATIDELRSASAAMAPTSISSARIGMALLPDLVDLLEHRPWPAMRSRSSRTGRRRR